MRTVMLCLILCASGCTTGDSLTPISHERILIDRSLSVPKQRFARFADSVVEAGDVWASSAKAGATLGIWWFPKNTNYSYPALDTTFTIDRLHAPVHVHRKQIRDTVHRSLTRVVNGIPPTTKTPLLEAIYYIEASVPRNSAWNLTIYSDLLHDGKTWAFPTDPVKLSDDRILEQMNRLCPPVQNPPSRISIVTWPGMLSRGQTSLEIHQEVINLYTTFFQSWAPGSRLEIGSIY